MGDLIHEHNPMVLCLQDTWHLDNACNSIFRDVSERYLFLDSSESILSGRPHVGTSILYNENFASNVMYIPVANKRICVIKRTPNNGTTLIIASVYTPCDNMRVTTSSPENLETISELEFICDKFSIFIILASNVGPLQSAACRCTLHGNAHCMGAWNTSSGTKQSSVKHN